MMLLGYAAAVYFGHGALIGSTQKDAQLVLSLGAGIYEELIFRLIGFNLLGFILIDLWQVPKSRAYVLMVVSSGLLFALYHYLGYEHFGWRTLAFRTAAGIYFGVIYLTRGFGVTAGTHTSYDIIVVLLGLAN
jgi:membrane protease YdiL (CAAX protease family)